MAIEWSSRRWKGCSMKIDVLTLFPEFVDAMRAYGVIGRAIERNQIDLQTTDIRSFSEDKHKRVDDTVYGGAAGMLMTPQPIVDALESIQEASGDTSQRVIFLSPQGRVLDQELCLSLSKESHLVLLCGHYEGIDARVLHHYVDEEISIGDYVLTGGELPAMVLIDSVARLVDGVLGNEDSFPTDSHFDGLLQYDEYTKPRDFRGYTVPEVLLNGNHKEIAKWREENRIENTMKKRPDLYRAYQNRLKSNKVEGEENGLH